MFFPASTAPNSTIFVSDMECEDIIWHDYLTCSCVVPAGSGVEIPLVVRVDGQEAYAYLSYRGCTQFLVRILIELTFCLVPEIYSIEPLRGSTFGGTLVSISGQNFGVYTATSVLFVGQTAEVLISGDQFGVCCQF